MAIYKLDYSVVEIYETYVVADSYDEAMKILVYGECDTGIKSESWMDTIFSVKMIEV